MNPFKWLYRFLDVGPPPPHLDKDGNEMSFFQSLDYSFGPEFKWSVATVIFLTIFGLTFAPLFGF